MKLIRQRSSSSSSRCRISQPIVIAEEDQPQQGIEGTSTKSTPINLKEKVTTKQTQPEKEVSLEDQAEIESESSNFEFVSKGEPEIEVVEIEKKVVVEEISVYIKEPTTQEETTLEEASLETKDFFEENESSAAKTK